MTLTNLCRPQVALVVLFLLPVGCSPEAKAPAQEPQRHVYAARRKVEADKLASIWLIKRFVDKEARFEFVADELPLTNGIPLDAPEGELRRYANNSCFETIVNKYRVQAPGMQRLDRIIRDIEINYWAEEYFPETMPLSEQIKAIIDKRPDSSEVYGKESMVVVNRHLKDVLQPIEQNAKASRQGGTAV